MNNPTDRQRLARATAEFWAGGGGPSHADLDRVLDDLDLLESTEGGTKYDRVADAVSAVDDRKLRSLLAALVDLLNERGFLDPEASFRVPDRAIDLFKKRLRPFGLDLNEDWEIEGGSGLGIEPAAMLDLPALENHIRRIQVALTSDDAQLLLGSSKELLETTAKFVLDECDVTVPAKFPGQLSAALEALGLHPKQAKSGDVEVEAATRQILGGLQQIGLGVNELRNEHGTGHGRIGAVRLSLRHARLAAGSACVLAIVMLDTFKDQGAPWRKARAETGSHGVDE